MTETTETYMPTKYDSPQDEFLHDLSAIWSVHSDGEVDSPTGWWMVLDVDTDDLLELRRDAQEAALRYGDTWLTTSVATLDHYAPLIAESPTEFSDYYRQVTGHFLLSGNDQGFCYVERFENVEQRDAKVAELDEAYGQWLDEAQPDPEF